MGRIAHGEETRESAGITRAPKAVLTQFSARCPSAAKLSASGELSGQKSTRTTAVTQVQKWHQQWVCLTTCMFRRCIPRYQALEMAGPSSAWSRAKCGSEVGLLRFRRRKKTRSFSANGWRKNRPHRWPADGTVERLQMSASAWPWTLLPAWPWPSRKPSPTHGS